MTRRQLEKIVKWLDNAVEKLVDYENDQDNSPIPDLVYRNITSAIALIENELTFEEEIEPLDFKKKTYHEAYEDLANSIEED